MALEVTKKIGNITEAKTGLNYELKSGSWELIDSGTVNASSDGTIHVPMAGKGVSLSDDLVMQVHNFNGVNFSTFGYSMFDVKVQDDGVAPPDVLKLIAIGDSFTATSNVDTGVRPSKGNITTFFSNYWVSAAYVWSANDYIFRPDMGKSGQTTRGALNIIEQYKASDADVVMLLLGANDFFIIPQAESWSNYELIVNGLLTSGKRVLIIPTYKRNNGGSWEDINTQCDELNAFVRSTFENTDGVFFSDVDTTIDNLMITHGNDGALSDDGLHFNNIGGLMAGVKVAEALDLHFPSTINKINLAPDSFTGTGGTAATGGVMPDGFYGSLASNTTEDAFTGPIDRGDGKVWWKVRASNQTLFRLNAVPTTSGFYTMECTVEFEQGAELVNRIEVTVYSSGTTYNPSELNTELVVDSSGMVSNGVKYRFRSPTGIMEDDTGVARFETRQDTGDDVIYYITDFKFYKVEDI